MNVCGYVFNEFKLLLFKSQEPKLWPLHTVAVTTVTDNKGLNRHGERAGASY